MLINSVHIEGFRGLAGPVNLDLTAPITLIYGPNGSGKTSVCDAIEWLLTGQVRRLASADVRCRLCDDDGATRVEAELIGGDGEVVTIRRAVSAQGDSLLMNNSKISPTKLLEYLTPNEVHSALTSQELNRLRKGWLRGTRFLGIDGLNTLIDSDQDAVKQRKSMLADLFGMASLNRAIDDSRKYLDALGTDRELSNKLAAERAALAEVEQEMQALRSNSLATLAERIANRRADAVNILAALFGDQLRHLSEDEMAWVIEVRSEYVALEATNEGRQTKLEYLGRNLPLYRSELERFAYLNAEQEKNQKDLASAHSEILAKKERLTSLRAKYRDREMLAANLREICDRLSSISEAVTNDRQRLSQYDVDPSTPIAALLESTRSQWQSAAALAQNANQEFENAQMARRDVASLRVAREEIVLSQRRLDNLSAQLLSDVALEESRRLLDENERNLVELESALSLIGGKLGLLRQTALETLSDLDRSTVCPVCLHDWGNIETLRQVLSDALESVGPEEHRLRRRALELREVIEDDAATIKKQEELRSLILEANDHIDGLRNVERLLSEKLLSIGAGVVTDLSSVDALLNVASDALRKCNETLRLAQLRYDIVRSISDSLEDFESHYRRLSSFVLEEVPDIVENGQELVVQWLDGKVKELVAACGILAAEIANEEDLMRSLDNQRLQLESVASVTSASCGEVSVWLESVRQIWKDLGGADEPGISSQLQLDAWRHSLDTRISLTEQLKHIVEEAESLLGDSADVRRLGEREIALEARIKDYEGKLTTFINQKSRAKALHEQLSDYRDEVLSRSVSSLQQAISALFLRVHSNPVFDSIFVSEPENGGINWIAKFTSTDNNNGLSPGELSQGQRQDLALAVFLAHARSIGGSFFLDEPFVYLDELNRTAVLDILRAIALDPESISTRLVITTASQQLWRHIREKFHRLPLGPDGSPKLRIYEFIGNVRIGTDWRQIWPRHH